MSLCITIGAVVTSLSLSSFTLAWTHSVEKVRWEEDWVIRRSKLELVEARIKGSGAGMEPGESAQLRDGWWVWQPDTPPLPELHLAASGATGAGWSLCSEGGCRALGSKPADDIELKACDKDR